MAMSEFYRYKFFTIHFNQYGWQCHYNGKVYGKWLGENVKQSDIFKDAEKTMDEVLQTEGATWV